ncbi:MAG: hypothetical protein KGH56_01030 [Patescibacteria group bacterium]|nr:hypothetical protein [Patescibacteria group bacterium]
MSDMHDAWFFIGIFIFIFLIWAATGGPLHPIAFTGPRLAEPGALGGGTYLSLPRSPFIIGGSNVSLPGSSSGGATSGSQTTLPTLGGGGVFGIPSPFRSLVWMNHYISGAGSSDPGNEYVEISVSQNAGVPVDLSEWTLQSDASGNSTIIPKGTDVPASGIINAAADIVLSPGENALVISGQSPIGASFRENKCIGYFGNFQKFSPALPQNCPAPSDELASFYGDSYIRDSACVDYVKSLSRCQVALSPPISVSGACQSFLIKYLNYNGCVDAHRNDPDFNGTTWRIYLGRTTAMWRAQHEIVKLIDVNGKTVDAFNY